MAVDKNSVMQKVQQFTRKGQWDRALGEMKKLCAEDHPDPMTTLRIGDLYLKVGDKENASLSYYKTAETFAREGHTAKAVAAYKMIKRIDPDYKDVDIRLEKLAMERLVSSAPRSMAGPTPAEAAPELESRADVIELSELPMSDPVIVQGTFSDVRDQDGVDDTGDYGNISFGGLVMAADYAELDEGLVGGSGKDFAEQSGENDITHLIEQGTLSGLDTAEPNPEDALEEAAREARHFPSPAAGQPMPLFSDIPREELSAMLGRMKKRSFSDGELIVREGEQGNSLFIIRQGGAKAVTRIKGIWVHLADLGERDFFGEVSVLTGRPRTADVVASGETEVLELTGAELKDVIDRYPAVEGTLRMFYENRLSDTLTTVKAVPKELFL